MRCLRKARTACWMVQPRCADKVKGGAHENATCDSLQPGGSTMHQEPLEPVSSACLNYDGSPLCL